MDRASVPFGDDSNPLRWPTDWDRIARRKGSREQPLRQRTEAEMEIERRLQTPVLLEFKGEPLANVMEYLSKLAGVNVYLDPQGLQQEAVTTEDPVTINLSQGSGPEKRVEPDPPATAPELRDQGRSPQDHQRADAQRRHLHQDLQRG